MAKNKIIFVIVGLIIICAGLYFGWRQVGWGTVSKKGDQVVNVNTLPSAFTVEVRNGSGKNGAGQQLADTLKQEGFAITSVGSAAKSDYDITLIYIKPGINPKNLLNVVRGSFVADLPAGESPSDSDIIIFIGKR